MAPSSHTVESFWKMMLENNVTLAIMLCPEMEKEKEMCIKYFEAKETLPDQPDQQFIFGDITLSIKSKKEKYPDLIVRKINVSYKNGASKVVTHLQEL